MDEPSASSMELDNIPQQPKVADLMARAGYTAACVPRIAAAIDRIMEQNSGRQGVTLNFAGDMSSAIPEGQKTLQVIRAATALTLTTPEDVEAAFLADPNTTPLYREMRESSLISDRQKQGFHEGVIAFLSANPKANLGDIYLPDNGADGKSIGRLLPRTKISIVDPQGYFKAHPGYFKDPERLRLFMPVLSRGRVDAATGYKMVGVADFLDWPEPRRFNYRKTEEDEKRYQAALESPSQLAQMLYELPLLDVPIIGSGHLRALMTNRTTTRNTTAFSLMQYYQGVLRVLVHAGPWRKPFWGATEDDPETIPSDDYEASVQRCMNYMAGDPEKQIPGDFMIEKWRILDEFEDAIFRELLTRYKPKGTEGEQVCKHRRKLPKKVGEENKEDEYLTLDFSLDAIIGDFHNFLVELFYINFSFCVRIVRHLEYTIMMLLSDYINPILRTAPTPEDLEALGGEDKIKNSAVDDDPHVSEVMFTPFEMVPLSQMTEELAQKNVRATNAVLIAIRRAMVGIDPEKTPLLLPPGEENYELCAGDPALSWIDAATLWTHFRHWICMDEFIETPDKIKAMMELFPTVRLSENMCKSLIRLHGSPETDPDEGVVVKYIKEEK